MEQTFRDHYNGQRGQSTSSFFVLSIFTETAFGIVREHLFLFMEGDVIKNILANPTSAAIISFLLALPIGFLRLARGGMLLLPVAFLLNLRPMLRREGPAGNKRIYRLNLIVGAMILLLILFTWAA